MNKTACVLFCVLISGCSGASTSLKPLGAVVVQPVTSIVWPLGIKRTSMTESNRIRKAIIAGDQTRFNGVWRRPSGNGDVQLVDCNRTDAIKVEFGASFGNISTSRSGARLLKIHWRHSTGVKNLVSEYSDGDLILGSELGPVRYFSTELSLGIVGDSPRRIDGDWVVTATDFADRLVFTETFRLLGCDEPYAPDWYEPADR